MSNSQNQNDSSLLWDCFTNWSLTLEKTTAKTAKKTRNKNSQNPNITIRFAQVSKISG
jgi:hypothetical protein